MLVKFVKFSRCFYYGLVRNELFLRSAALTYYAIFSIFPLTILITSAMGWVLQDPEKQEAIVSALIELMPEGTQIITDLLQSVITTSTITSVIALLTLLWSATGFFRGLFAAIDLIHARQYTYSTFLMRGLGVVIILLAVPALFLLLLLAGLSKSILAAFPLPEGLSLLLSFLASGFPMFAIAALAFFFMLRYIPAQRTPLVISVISSVITALAWVLLGYGFSWYLSSGFANFNVIYGSIGAVMALMLYLFLSNVTILMGAQINASLAYFEKCTTPYIPGFDDALKLLHLPLPPTDEEEQPPNKPTIAP